MIAEVRAGETQVATWRACGGHKACFEEAGGLPTHSCPAPIHSPPWSQNNPLQAKILCWDPVRAKWVTSCCSPDVSFKKWTRLGAKGNVASLPSTLQPRRNINIHTLTSFPLKQQSSSVSPLGMDYDYLALMESSGPVSGIQQALPHGHQKEERMPSNLWHLLEPQCLFLRSNSYPLFSQVRCHFIRS